MAKPGNWGSKTKKPVGATLSESLLTALGGRTYEGFLKELADKFKNTPDLALIRETAKELGVELTRWNSQTIAKSLYEIRPDLWKLPVISRITKMHDFRFKLPDDDMRLFTAFKQSLGADKQAKVISTLMRAYGAAVLSGRINIGTMVPSAESINKDELEALCRMLDTFNLGQPIPKK